MRRVPVRKLSFTLVELVIVIIIIGVVATIAVPRISRGARGAADAALKSDLATMRRAIELYCAEHGGLFPLKKDQFVEQMTKYTNIYGDVSDTKTSEFLFGPYLKSTPPLPLGKYKGDARVTDGGDPGNKNDGGWWYDEDTGEIRANLKNEETDDSGTPYNQY